jgi:hypothetical protein
MIEMASRQGAPGAAVCWDGIGFARIFPYMGNVPLAALATRGHLYDFNEWFGQSR